MPRVVFTPQLERFLDAPTVQADGACVAAVLTAVFRDNQRLGRYVLDEHGRLRPHVNVFVDGQAIRDRDRLSDVVPADGEVFVMQALSGG